MQIDEFKASEQIPLLLEALRKEGVGRYTVEQLAYVLQCARNIATDHEKCLIDALIEANKELKWAEDSEDAISEKLRALAPHGTCACSYDRPGDACMHHSPQVQKLEDNCRKLEEKIKELERGK